MTEGEFMDTILFIVACPLFLVSIGGYIYVKLRLRKDADTDLDEYYHEFEDLHPGLARYAKWSQITFSAAVIAVLLIFIAAML